MLLILVLLSLAASEACGAMSAVTAKQLQCVFPSLDATSASTYAQWMSKLMGTPLRTTTSCQWAAMLGNIGGETDGLKQLSQSSCSENQPFCARGPLSLFSEEQYRFCSSNSLCYNCANIVEEPSQVSSDAAVGVGSAACAWGALFGENLNLRADGSHAGFMQTAKLLSCGHLSCEEPTAWGKRLMYWMKATACLSEEAPEPAAYNSYNSGDSYSTYSASNTGNNGYGTYSSYNSNTGYTQSSSNGNSQSSSNGYSQTSASYTGYSQSSSNGYSQSSSNGYSQTSGSYTGYYSSSNNGISTNGVSTSSSASSGPASTGYNSYSTGDNSNSYNSYNSGNNGYNSYNSGSSGYNSYSGNSYGGGNQ